MKRFLRIVVPAIFLGSAFLGAQSLPPRLLSDIMPGRGEPLSSNPFPRTLVSSNLFSGKNVPFPRIGGVVYFAAWDCRHGREIWSALPYPGMVRLVADLVPGRGFGIGHEPGITAFRGHLYFFVDRAGEDCGIYRSDGSPAGTYLLWKPADVGFDFLDALVAAGKLFFFTRRNLNSVPFDFYCYDGLSSKPQLLAKGLTSTWAEAAVAGGKVFFLLGSGSTFKGLWVTDGTAGGTKVITGTLSLDAIAKGLAEAGGWIYFAGRDSRGWAVWKTDGLKVVKVASMPKNTSWTSPVALGNRIVFGMEGAWALDTLQGRFQQLKTANPKNSHAYQSPVPAWGRVYFASNDGSFLQWALWTTDGTPAGTRKVASLGNANTGWEIPVVAGNRIFFRAVTNATGGELWVTDGTKGGTGLVRDIYPGKQGAAPDFLTPVASGKILFAARSPAQGRELWISDGTKAGTTLLADIGKGFNSPGSDPSKPLAFYGRLFFLAHDPSFGVNLWISQAFGKNALSLRRLKPGLTWSAPRAGTVLGRGALFAVPSSGTAGRFLLTNGTAAGTSLLSVKTLFYGGFFGATKDWALFLGRRTTEGSEPWVTDGTPAGTRVLKDLTPGFRSSTILWGLSAGDKVFFAALTGFPVVKSLWVTDGTSKGTVLLGKNFDELADPILLGKSLLFRAAVKGSLHGKEPWISDGTPAGTKELVDLAPGTKSGGFYSPFHVGDRVLFFGDDGRSIPLGRLGLFSTDGTAAGTRRVILPTFSNRPFPSAFRVNGKVGLFWGDDGIHGLEPWVTDGTVWGTFLLADLAEGKRGSWPKGKMVKVGSRRAAALWGSMDDAGILLTDGTRAGTRILRGDTFCPIGNTGDFLAFAGGCLYFSADDETHGMEPWVWDVGATVERIGWCSGKASLEGEDPVLGGKARLALRGIPAGGTGLVLFGKPSAAPVPLGKGAGLFLDLSGGSFFSVLPGRGGLLDLALPNDPVLAGVRIAAQAVAGPSSSGPWGMDFTNGLLLTLGY